VRSGLFLVERILTVAIFSSDCSPKKVISTPAWTLFCLACPAFWYSCCTMEFIDEPAGLVLTAPYSFFSRFLVSSPSSWVRKFRIRVFERFSFFALLSYDGP